MGFITKNQIRNILIGTNKEEYSHVFICVDKWDYDYFSSYVSRDEDIDEAIDNFYEKHQGGMIKIEEIYNLDLDIESQLNEVRSNHREKAKKKGEIKLDNKKNDNNLSFNEKLINGINKMSTIKKLLNKNKDNKYSHVIIFYDRCTHEYSATYIERGTPHIDILNKITEVKALVEVYGIFNYEMDLHKQLLEDNPIHLETKDYSLEKNDIEKKAYKFAYEKHKGQYRKGESHKEYITHPVNVANLVEIYKGDSHGIHELKAAAYLHDILEDTDTTFNELVKEFGIDIARLVQEVTTIDEFKDEIGKAKYLATKMIHMSDWGLNIKLCDTLDNVSDLVEVNEEFREKCINEKIYVLTELLNNRQLTKTQLLIVTDITKVMATITKYQMDEETNNKVNNILSLLNRSNKNIA